MTHNMTSRVMVRAGGVQIYAYDAGTGILTIDHNTFTDVHLPRIVELVKDATARGARVIVTRHMDELRNLLADKRVPVQCVRATLGTRQLVMELTYNLNGTSPAALALTARSAIYSMGGNSVMSFDHRTMLLELNTELSVAGWNCMQAMNFIHGIMNGINGQPPSRVYVLGDAKALRDLLEDNLSYIQVTGTNGKTMVTEVVKPTEEPDVKHDYRE